MKYDDKTFEELKKQAFISNDIIQKDWDSENIERYEYQHLTAEEIRQDYEEIDGKLTAKIKDDEKLLDIARDYLSFGEFYCVPMMNALYYFPSFCSFDLQKELENGSQYNAVALVYDSELEAYAVAMTGGGMDLSPHLLDLFISLQRGIPENIAFAVDVNYSGYIDEEKHKQNMAILMEAMERKAEQWKNRVEEIKNKLKI